MIRIICLLLIVLFAGIAQAETLYVISPKSTLLYSKPGKGAAVIGQLKPKAKLQLVGTDLKSGYAMVVTDKQTRGWVKISHVSPDPNRRVAFITPKPEAAPPGHRVAPEQAISTAPAATPDTDKPEPTSLVHATNTIASIKPKHVSPDMLVNNPVSDRAKQHAQSMMSSVKDHLQGVSENKHVDTPKPRPLSKDVSTLQHQVSELQFNNALLQQSQNRTWLLTGAIIVLISLLVGFLVGRVTARARRSQW
ncbi:MAG: hypothetical protein CMF50_06635 [Legionellales bacterium]|nr:hypothetical protein [Legionellales bacterium]